MTLEVYTLSDLFSDISKLFYILKMQYKISIKGEDEMLEMYLFSPLDFLWQIKSFKQAWKKRSLERLE